MPAPVEQARPCARVASSYARREPERTLLHQTVREHWKTLLAELAQRTDGGSLPGFVVAEFERYLACGVLANGFARVRCGECGKESLVGLSCKGRGICPSCTTRRMQGTATHLLERVLPRVPMRQWVLSLPRWARFLLARDPALITRTLDVGLREIFKSHRRRARAKGARAAKAGAVTFVQRFGSALNLNVHFHSVVPDGVFVREDGAIRFVEITSPDDEELTKILLRIARRVRKLLKPRIEKDRDDDTPPDALAMAQADSVTSLPISKTAWVGKKHAVYFEGFSLHAGVHLHANDREGLGHLCGYGARPALSQERLSSRPDGKLELSLKRPMADGRETLVLEPVELLRRLATLVPPPRAHLVRFHGVFGPASTWRREIVPAPEMLQPEDSRDGLLAPPLASDDGPETSEVKSKPNLRRLDSKVPWAELLLRVFREDVLACACGGRRRVIAFVTQRKAVKSILEHLGHPTTGPPLAPARSSAHGEYQPWQDDVPTLQQSLR